MFNSSKKIKIIIEVVTILLLLFLPYYLFQGKLFIGGDDTRLLYIYPWEFLKNISFYSWYNFSSVGTYNPNQFSVPFTAVWSLLATVIQSKIILDYLSFSLPLILGFIYFQKFVKVIFDKDKYNTEIFIGSLVYTLSPILLQNQLSIFLYAAWLVGLLPIMSYYFICYIKTGNISFIIKNVLFCTWLSFALFSIPWWLGYILPVLVGLVFTIFLYKKTEIKLFVKRIFVHGVILVLSQSFWLVPFMSTFVKGGNNSYGGQILSEQTANSFVSTVLSTASGSVLFPILNLFHRQITFDYNWGLKAVYESFYDQILFVNCIYIVILFLGAIFVSTTFKLEKRRYYISVLVMFLVSLFLFTVNIGPLKELFLTLHVLPGVAMFRNFYDKFALGYTLIYALLITFSLIIIAIKFPKKKNYINIALVIVLIVNFISVKEVIVRPIWGTSSIKMNINISQEYLDFMDDIQQTVPSSATILSLPYNIASYTFIKDTDSKNVFAGTSPVKIFSGVNDFSGNLSFSSDADKFTKAIERRDYQTIQNILQKYNISYIFVTKNIPNEMKSTYLFPKNMMAVQDDTFIKNLSEKKILSSSAGNYELYLLKKRGDIIRGDNLTFTKINQAEYKIHIKNAKKGQQLLFLDSYHNGWNLYLDATKFYCNATYVYSSECRSEKNVIGNFSHIVGTPVFADSHSPYKEFGNSWNIKTSDFAKENKDIYLTLYFTPQLYFYIGTVISLLTFCMLIIIFILRRQKINER